jgi:primosomal protein N'
MTNKQIITILNDAFPLFIGKPLTEEDDSVSYQPRPGLKVTLDWSNKEELGGIAISIVDENKDKSLEEVLSFAQVLRMDYQGVAEWINRRCGLSEW